LSKADVEDMRAESAAAWVRRLPASHVLPKFHVLITTYEYADDPVVQSVQWDALVVDEVGCCVKDAHPGSRIWGPGIQR
jgi:SNF2 family DNA or RNA helicase